MKGAMMDAQQKAARAFRDQTISELAAGQQVHAAQARVAANDKVRAQLTAVLAAPGSARCLHAWWVRLPRPVGVKGLICLMRGTFTDWRLAACSGCRGDEKRCGGRREAGS